MNSIFTSLFSPQKVAGVSPSRYSPERSPDREKGVLRSPLKRRGLGYVRNGVRKSVSFELPDETEVTTREATPTPTAASVEESVTEKGDHEEGETEEEVEAEAEAEAEAQSVAQVGDKSSDADETDDTDDAAEYEIQALVDHRWDDGSIEVRVEWAQGGDTWEPELNLHEDANAMLLNYWKEVGGRPVNPEDPDLFHVARILQATPNGKKLFVEWVGYGPEERTWELKKEMEQAAPEAVAKFLKLQRAKARKPTKKRRRRVGRI